MSTERHINDVKDVKEDINGRVDHTEKSVSLMTRYMNIRMLEEQKAKRIKNKEIIWEISNIKTRANIKAPGAGGDTERPNVTSPSTPEDIWESSSPRLKIEKILKTATQQKKQITDNGSQFCFIQTS